MKTQVSRTYIFLGIFALLIIGDVHAQNFNNPESMVFDSVRDRYLVSNKSGGFISQIKSDWSVSRIYENCNSPKGLFIIDNKLYIATNMDVLILDLNTDKLSSTISIKESKFLNDITSDNRGKLWVSDTYANKIFEINLYTEEYKIFLDTGNDAPNGLLYNNDMLYIGYWESSNDALETYDMKANKINGIKYNGSIDGIAISKSGNLYFSNWYPPEILEIPPDFSSLPDVVSSEQNGPADISIMQQNDKEFLLVPNFLSNSIDIYLMEGDNSLKHFKSIK